MASVGQAHAGPSPGCSARLGSGVFFKRDVLGGLGCGGFRCRSFYRRSVLFDSINTHSIGVNPLNLDVTFD